MRPQSVSNPWVVLSGLLAFIIALFVIRGVDLFQRSSVMASLFAIGLTVLVIAIGDLAFVRVHRRASTGLDFLRSNFSASRSIIKYLGFLMSLAFVAALYWLFTEYHGDFYTNYFQTLVWLAPVVLPLALIYIAFIDQYMKQPEDSYYVLGMFVVDPKNAIQKLKQVNLGQHFLGWLVKAYFLPLMFTYMTRNITKFKTFDFSTIQNFQSFFDFSHDSLFMIDVGLVTMGYVFSLRLLDSHIRSSEPTVKGWVFALVCYEPFWSLFGAQYLAYSGQPTWGSWLSGSWVYPIWGSLILALVVIYVWASVMFGARFSNLTHRGIITNGVYAWTKHPAYVAKNLSWWMMSIPFLAAEPSQAFRRSLLLLGLNGIYFLRARTEEAHLSRDADYVEYAEYMNQHSVFAGLAKVRGLRWLRYDQKKLV